MSLKGYVLQHVEKGHFSRPHNKDFELVDISDEDVCRIVKNYPFLKNTNKNIKLRIINIK